MFSTVKITTMVFNLRLYSIKLPKSKERKDKKACNEHSTHFKLLFTITYIFNVPGCWREGAKGGEWEREMEG
jgi:hypothetical protein